MTTVPDGNLVGKRTIWRCSSSGERALGVASSNGTAPTEASNAAELLADADESGAAPAEVIQKAAARMLAAFSADNVMFMISPVYTGISVAKLKGSRGYVLPSGITSKKTIFIF